MLAALLSFLFVSAPAAAEAWRSILELSALRLSGEQCQLVDPVTIQGTQAYADSLSDGACFASISPIETTGLLYRQHIILSGGLLLVFNSYCEGGDTLRCTGAREFHFFPRRNPPLLEADRTAQTISVTLPNGRALSFDPSTAQMAAAENGQVLVAPIISPNNNGGVEFPRYGGLMLDCGFRLGELPSARRNGESVFRDGFGRSCRVTNEEIFTYSGRDRSFRFDDAALSAWLKERCPALSPDF